MEAPIGEISRIRSPQAVGEGGRRAPDAQALQQAAAEFESLLVAETLKSMREAGDGGWFGAGEDQASATIIEMAEQQVAQAIASSGGLGLASLILQGLRPPADKESG
ncbi:MAG: rod-binding protein [Bryobacteraceae bacterium]|nr:rod-binding protein [Bryobacteraceae bacterium]